MKRSIFKVRIIDGENVTYDLVTFCPSCSEDVTGCEGFKRVSGSSEDCVNGCDHQYMHPYFN